MKKSCTVPKITPLHDIHTYISPWKFIFISLPDTYSTAVSLISTTPTVAGSTVQFFCNITKVGYPVEIIRYEWMRGKLNLEDSLRYHGSNTNTFTIAVRKEVYCKGSCSNIEGILISISRWRCLRYIMALKNEFAIFGKFRKIKLLPFV